MGRVKQSPPESLELQLVGLVSLDSAPLRLSPWPLLPGGEDPHVVEIAFAQVHKPGKAAAVGRKSELRMQQRLAVDVQLGDAVGKNLRDHVMPAVRNAFGPGRVRLCQLGPVALQPAAALARGKGKQTARCANRPDRATRNRTDRRGPRWRRRTRSAAARSPSGPPPGRPGPARGARRREWSTCPGDRPLRAPTAAAENRRPGFRASPPDPG